MGFNKLFLTIFFFIAFINANDKFDDYQIGVMLNEYFLSEKGPTLLGHRFYETKKNRNFKRGYTIQLLKSPGPIEAFHYLKKLY